MIDLNKFGEIVREKYPELEVLQKEDTLKITKYFPNTDMVGSVDTPTRFEITLYSHSIIIRDRLYTSFDGSVDKHKFVIYFCDNLLSEVKVLWSKFVGQS